MAAFAIGMFSLAFVLLVVASLDAFLLSRQARSSSGERGGRTFPKRFRPKPPAKVYGFPVIVPQALPAAEDEDGPGRYRIIGVVRETGADIKMSVEALTMANAKVKAELKGVIVTFVQKQQPRSHDDGKNG